MTAGREAPSLWHSQELQSGLVRLAAWLAMALFVGIGGMRGHYDVDWGLYAWLFGVHLVWFLALLVAVIQRPELQLWRTRVAIFADLSAITLLIYISGELLAPFYLVYILSFLSQGTRYGRVNLSIASAGSVASYALIATVMGGWQAHAFEVGFILAALVILPLYQDALLRNLQSARQRAEAANAARGEFLATMSHELRTPLAGMLGTARLLRSTELDTEQRRCVDSLCASAETMQALIGDILDLSKIDAGSLELQPEWFDLRRCLLDVCRNLSEQALAKQVELVCCIDMELPEYVFADRVRFEQILYNLVGNAVKFTHAGRVCVAAERALPRPDLDQRHLEIVIADTGIGIPRERLECIFDSYWQAHPQSSRDYGGIGLGTAIAYRLTQAMGGIISADSERDAGTTFRLHLPLLPDGDADRPPQPPPELSGSTVLVYEADPESRSSLEAACRRAGMEVFSCSEGVECERQLQASPQGGWLDLAVIADSPQGIDLEQRAEELRARIRPDLPVLLVGYASRLALYAPAHLPAVAKPLHAGELWVGMCRALRATACSRQSVAGPRWTGSSVEARRVLVVEDDRINRELVETLLQRQGYDVEVVADAASALARLEARAFDVLLVDLRLPGMNGVEFTRRVRRRERADQHVPIIALTASVAVEAREEAVSAGMDGFLVKPVEPHRLENLIAGFTPA